MRASYFIICSNVRECFFRGISELWIVRMDHMPTTIYKILNNNLKFDQEISTIFSKFLPRARIMFLAIQIHVQNPKQFLTSECCKAINSLDLHQMTKITTVLSSNVLDQIHWATFTTAQNHQVCLRVPYSIFFKSNF